MNAASTDDGAPRVGRVRFGPALAGALYLLLVGSAALSLWVREFPGRVPAALAEAAPWVFLAFAGCFAVYRLVLVRSGKYPAFKAFFQIGAASLFFTLLLPGEVGPRDRRGDTLDVLMADSDPRIRALAAELAGYRGDGAAHAPALVRALEDPDERVRTKAHRSLVRLSGRDLGPPGDEAARARWRELYR